MKKTIVPALLLLLVLTYSVWLRWPTLNEGNPYFYHEDEAHHYNRLVDMVKRGSLNPEYFHKPSLHFYLRMPAVLLGFWVSKRAGEIRSVKDLRTRDRFGLAKYSFSWSHPTVVIFVRAVTLMLVLLTCGLVFVAARLLSINVPAGIIAVLFLSASPEIFNYSGFIGVDVPLMFFSLLASVIALWALRTPTSSAIWLLGIVSGLAVSCKYNGMPIALLAILVLWSSTRAKKLKLTKLLIVAALIGPIVGFFIGSPYILVSMPLFVKQLSYEIWHYAVAGHAGHSASPGLPQVAHYLHWLCGDGLGLAVTALTLVGIPCMARMLGARGAIFLSFPILFFALMCAQKANFVRNMLPILPYLVIAAAYTLQLCISRVCSQRYLTYPLYALLGIGLVIAPLSSTLLLRSHAVALTDTRSDLKRWIVALSEVSDIAISGDIQPAPSLTQLKGVSVVDPTTNLEQLYLSGFDRVVRISPITNEQSPVSATIHEEHVLYGSTEPSRVLKSPQIYIYRFSDSNSIDLETSTIPIHTVTIAQPISIAGENHLWLTEKLSRITLNGLPKNSSERETPLRIDVMSPWSGQKIDFIGKNWQQQILLNQKNPGEWNSIELTVPAGQLRNQDSLIIRLSTVSSPATRALSSDTRRLGIAIQGVGLLKE